MMDISRIYTSPMYVFDVRVLKERIRFLENGFSGMGLCYAIKANTFIISYIADNVKRFEVCSPGELDICYNQNIPLSKVVVSGVFKDRKVIENAIKNYPEIGFYTVESIGQLQLLDELSSKYNRNLNVLIRLSSGNQFGVDSNQVYDIIKNRNCYSNLCFKGLEYYSGTQKTSLKKIEKELFKIDELISKLSNELGYTVEELEYGPGYPVSYFEGEKDFDDAKYLEELKELLNNMNFKGDIILELGRAIAASCGTYYTKIVDIKETNEQNMAICDGGMNHIVYYGQMMAMKKPFFDIIPSRHDNFKVWNIFGALCSVNDIMMKQVSLDIKQGDILAFKNAGAYCMTEDISLFLSRDLPKIYINDNNKFIVVRDELKTSILNSMMGGVGNGEID